MNFADTLPYTVFSGTSFGYDYTCCNYSAILPIVAPGQVVVLDPIHMRFPMMKYSLRQDLRKCWIACSVWAILMCMLPEVIPGSCPATLWPSSVVEVMWSESIRSPLQSFILPMTVIMMMHGMITWLMEDCRRLQDLKVNDRNQIIWRICLQMSIWRMSLKEIGFSMIWLRKKNRVRNLIPCVICRALSRRLLLWMAVRSLGEMITASYRAAEIIEKREITSD